MAAWHGRSNENLLLDEVGRQAAGMGPSSKLRLSKDTEAAVFKWAANNDITRSEAMRRLLELGLKKTPPKAKSGKRSPR
jgi:hypothetical protein